MNRLGIYFLIWIRIRDVCSIEIENGLIGTPDVKCGSDTIDLVFDTENPFQGNIYAKGFFDDSRCLQGATDTNQVNFALNLNEICGVSRRRSTQPKGMYVEATVVIMFHQMFITKVDRAFRVQCLYQEQEKILTQELDVSMIPTEEVTDLLNMPTCFYEVLRGGPDGPVVRFAQIGEKVFHKWTCAGGTDEALCMTVKDCTVDDGQGNVRVLLDHEGCAQDRYLLQNLVYLTPLMAGRESHVFKFADKPTVHFKCQIQLHMKTNGICARTSDNCEPESSDNFETIPPTITVFRGSPSTQAFPTPPAFPVPRSRARWLKRLKQLRRRGRAREKRELQFDPYHETLVDIDVTSEPFTVIGIQDTPGSYADQALSKLRNYGRVTLMTPSSFLCVSRSTAGVTVTLMAALLLSTCVSVFWIYKLKYGSQDPPSKDDYIM